MIYKTIEEIPELSKPISILNIVKYSKQAYYNGNPEYTLYLHHRNKVLFLVTPKNATKGSTIIS
jgi:hypothetical protein